METTEKECETSGSRTQAVMIGLRDFLFQKSYADEMVTCLQAFVCNQCEGCLHLTDIHSCVNELDLLQYWHEAKHYFSRDNVVIAMNKRCDKYDLEVFQDYEWPAFLRKTESEWLDQIQMMVVMFTV